MHSYAHIITGNELGNNMDVLESRDVTKLFVPKLDVKSDQDNSQELSSKVDV